MAPAPILFSAIFAVGTEFMSEDHQRFFMNDTTTSISWAQDAFRVAYNTYFQDPDYYIGSNESVLTARLRPLISTMEIVGADELELSWPEFIEFQTGYPLRQPQAEMLSFRIGKAMRVGTGDWANSVEYRHFGRTFNHSVTKNRLLQQGGVLLGVVGNWSRPVYDGQGVGTPSINRLTHPDDWFVRPLDDTLHDDILGSLSATNNSINLFHGGEIYVPNEIDITNVITVKAGDVDVGTFATGVDTETDAEGNTGDDEDDTEQDYLRFYCESWMGMSALTGINFGIGV